MAAGLLEGSRNTAAAVTGQWKRLTSRGACYADPFEGLPAEVVTADTAYDADYLRQAVAAKGATAVIPNTPSRALKYALDKHLYAQRHLVECSFSKLKQLRRVATRFKKTHAIILPSSLSPLSSL